MGPGDKPRDDTWRVMTAVDMGRNRITGGGVTAGIDFGLALAAELIGRPNAEGIQLFMEYNPAPPFDAGSPETADPAILELFRKTMHDAIATRRAAVERAAANLKH